MPRKARQPNRIFLATEGPVPLAVDQENWVFTSAKGALNEYVQSFALPSEEDVVILEYKLVRIRQAKGRWQIVK